MSLSSVSPDPDLRAASAQLAAKPKQLSKCSRLIRVYPPQRGVLSGTHACVQGSDRKRVADDDDNDHDELQGSASKKVARSLSLPSTDEPR